MWKWQISGRQFGQHFLTTFISMTPLTVMRTSVICMLLCSEKKFMNCSTSVGSSLDITANATGRPTPLPSSTSRVISTYLILCVWKLHNINYNYQLFFYMVSTVVISDHSFPRNAEFWAKALNLPISAEFPCFRGIFGIQYWAVIRRQVQHSLMEFGLPYCMYTWFHHEIHCVSKKGPQHYRL